MLYLLSVQANGIRGYRVLCAAQEILTDNLAACVSSFGDAPGDLGACQVPGR